MKYRRKCRASTKKTAILFIWMAAVPGRKNEVIGNPNPQKFLIRKSASKTLTNAHRHTHTHAQREREGQGEMERKRNAPERNRGQGGVKGRHTLLPQTHRAI